MLLKKIKSKKINVLIAGCGYTGYPLADLISKQGIKVVGYDINRKLVNKLNSLKNKQNKYLSFTHNINTIKKIDIILISLPTPLTKNFEPDLSYIQNFLNSCSKILKKNQIMILESTTYPGTTDQILKLFLEKKNFKIGKNYFLGYSPERIDPGRNIKLNEIIKICSGSTNKCKTYIREFYKLFMNKVELLENNRTAEFVKIFENIFRSINISLVNEMKMIADKFDVDIREVINAASTKPYGFMKFDPGPGIGGHCIPVDPFYLTWKAKEYNIHTRFIELAGEINNSMPLWIFEKINNYLIQKNLFIKKTKFLFIGVTYKKNIADTRESPSIKFFNIFKKKNLFFDYHDPYVKKFKFKLDSKVIKLNSIPLNKKNIKKYDCVIILTDHDNIDYKLIKNNSNLIFDSRGILKKSKNVIYI